MVEAVIAPAAAGGAIGSAAAALLTAVWQRRASRETLRDQPLVRAHASFLAAMSKLARDDPRGRTVNEEELQLLVVDGSAGEYADKARRVLNSGLPAQLHAIDGGSVDVPVPEGGG